MPAAFRGLHCDAGGGGGRSLDQTHRRLVQGAAFAWQGHGRPSMAFSEAVAEQHALTGSSCSCVLLTGTALPCRVLPWQVSLCVTRRRRLQALCSCRRRAWPAVTCSAAIPSCQTDVPSRQSKRLPRPARGCQTAAVWSSTRKVRAPPRRAVAAPLLWRLARSVLRAAAASG